MSSAGDLEDCGASPREPSRRSRAYFSSVVRPDKRAIGWYQVRPSSDVLGGVDLQRTSQRETRAVNEETRGGRHVGVARSPFAPASGGAAAGYHVVEGWAGSYPEVTGYFVPTLLYYGERFQNPALCEIGERAGGWPDTRLPGGAICRKQWFAGNISPSVFNTAQVIEGWCALAPGSASIRCGDWLLLASLAIGFSANRRPTEAG